MLDALLPRRIDNTFRGFKVALWLFGAVVLMKTAIALGCIFNGYEAASSADGIPLATFSPAAVRTVLAEFAIWGVAQIVICLLCILALVRYRSMVPLMFTLILLEQLARKLALHFLPIPRSGAPPGVVINLALIGVMIVGVILCFRRQPALQPHA